MINNYNQFLIEKEFQSIINDIIKITESKSTWLDNNVIEWDFTKDTSVKDKLVKFLSKLSKEEIKNYFYKLVEGLKYLPKNARKRLIVNYAAVFLSFVSTGYLFDSPANDDILLDSDIKTEILKIDNRKSDFDLAQNIVKQVEAGYSSDRGDRGNWINLKTGGRRFIGTNHGISAPILAEYLGRLPSKEDMINLTYEEALEIYKSKYWNPQNLDEFKDQLVANIIYDGCVNQGIEGMKSIIRNSMIENGIDISSSENPFKIEWIEKINNLNQMDFFNSIKNNRKERYKTARTFKRHGKGWINRLNDFEYNV